MDIRQPNTQIDKYKEIQQKESMKKKDQTYEDDNNGKNCKIAKQKNFFFRLYHGTYIRW